MIEIFRKNIFINSLLLLPYTGLLRIYTLVNPTSYQVTDSDGPLVEMVYNLLGNSGLLQAILAIILIFFQAAFINRLVIMNRLENEQTLLPGVFYIIIVSAIPDFLTLSPLLIGLTFVLFSLIEIFKIYKKPKSEHLMFSGGFWVGVAALFYLPYLLYLLVSLVGHMILRSFKVKEWLQILSGIGVPIFLFGTVLFWNDSLKQLALYFTSNAGFIESFRAFTSKDIIVFSALGVLILSALLSYGGMTGRKSIQIAKKIDILYWGLFICLFAFGFKQPDLLSGVQIMAFPLCVFVSFLFQRVENRMFAEMFHLVMITGIIIGQFQGF